MGFSPHHAHTVSLMLNNSTQSITPQYHVVHDDGFSTVASNGTVNYDQFLHLMTITSARTKAFLEDPDNALLLANEWLTSDEQEVRESIRRQQVLSTGTPRVENNDIMHDDVYPNALPSSTTSHQREDSQ